MAIRADGYEVGDRIDNVGTLRNRQRNDMMDVNEICPHWPIDTRKVKSADGAGRTVNLDTLASRGSVPLICCDPNLLHHTFIHAIFFRLW